MTQCERIASPPALVFIGVICGQNSFEYDDLHRLKNFDRGDLTGSPYSSIAGTPADEQDWALDQLGNWSGYVEKSAGTTTLNQTRVHNKVNEIDVDDDHANSPGASITGSGAANWSDPSYDAAGNLTLSPLSSGPGISTNTTPGTGSSARRLPVTPPPPTSTTASINGLSATPSPPRRPGPRCTTTTTTSGSC